MPPAACLGIPALCGSWRERDKSINPPMITEPERHTELHPDVLARFARCLSTLPNAALLLVADATLFSWRSGMVIALVDREDLANRDIE